MLRQRSRRRIVEHEAAHQPQPGRRRQPVAQLHRRQRVEAELPERASRGHRLRRAVPQHRRRLLAHQRQHDPLPLLRGRACQPRRQQPLRHRRAAARARRAHACHLRQLAQHRGQVGGGSARQQLLPLHVRHHHVRLAALEHLRHRLQRRGGRQLAHAAGAQPLPHSVRHALAGPRAPAERAGSQAAIAALLGERIQERVRRRVRPLPGVAERARDRGEEHERVEIQPLGQLVQVPRRIHLRAQHALQALGAQPLDQAVVEHSRHVEDPGQRVLLGHLGEQPLQLRAVGGVAGDHAHFRAQLLELRAQLRGAWCIQAAAAAQQQVLGAALRQPAREVPAERAGPARHQHRARRGVRVRCRAGAEWGW